MVDIVFGGDSDCVLERGFILRGQMGVTVFVNFIGGGSYPRIAHVDIQDCRHC
jgi:hypothetical protein